MGSLSGSEDEVGASALVDPSSCETTNYETTNDDKRNDDSDDEDIVAPSEESTVPFESNKKRKRPASSHLRNAMGELDRIWNYPDAEEGQDENMATNSANKKRPSVPVLSLPEMDRIRQTTALLVKVFSQDIHKPAARALAINEELKDKQMEMKTELETNQKEVERLKRSEQRSKEAIQNLLKAIGESAEDTKDASQSKLVEAKMRADLLHATSERDVNKKDLMVAQRSLELLSRDIENLKKEKSKLQHEKLRLEREVRAARALADGLSSSMLGNDHREDLNYYKGRTKELEAHLHGMTASLAEKNRDIQDLRRSNERSWSQQRLEALKMAGKPAIPSSRRNSKPSRHSC